MPLFNFLKFVLKLRYCVLVMIATIKKIAAKRLKIKFKGSHTIYLGVVRKM